jgi:hypothetical protein
MAVVVQPFFEWRNECVGRCVDYPRGWITCMSNLNVVDKQASDVGDKLAIVEIGLVISVRVPLLIMLISAR